MKGAKHAAPSKQVDVSGRTTNEDAQREGRCLCQGCPACRGLPGYPCASLVTDDATRCRYCR